jgi:hypothetical protein
MQGLCSGRVCKKDTYNPTIFLDARDFEAKVIIVSISAAALGKVWPVEQMVDDESDSQKRARVERRLYTTFDDAPWRPHDFRPIK